MKISEVHIVLPQGQSGDDDRVAGKLMAFVSFVLSGELGNIVVRDAKIVRDGHGLPMLSMPAKKVMHRCGGCQHKNGYGSSYCNGCGHKLEWQRTDGPHRVYSDLVHPIDRGTRDRLTDRILDEYGQAMAREKAGAEAKAQPAEQKAAA